MTESGRDPLTGLLDRSAFAELETVFSSRESSWSLIIIDIDHFKLVNDIYGHLTGDEILSHVGKTISLNLKHNDHAIRFGGDEFVVVLPDTDGQGALDLAQRLLFEMENREFPGGLHVSASLGIAQSKPEHTKLEEMISSADQALYRAKESGRGRFVLADDLLPDRETEPDFSHMVGRREELHLLRELLDQTMEGSARLCLITGYQGMGKTRLVEELRHYCRFRNAPVFWSTTNPVREEDHFQVSDIALQMLSSLTAEELQKVRENCGPLLPETAEMFRHFNFTPGNRVEPFDRETLLIRMRKDIACIMRSISDLHSCVLVIDNLQWASVQSIRFLVSTMTELRDSGILFIAIGRNGNLSGPFGPALTTLPSKQIGLSPLTRTDVRTMLFFAMKTPGVPVDVIDYMMRQSGGNTLFLRILISWCVDTGALETGKGDDCFWLEPSEDALPPELVSRMDHMLQNLAAEELKVLKRAALAGRYLDLNLLSLLTGMSEFSLAEILDEFVQRGLMTDDGTSYNFVFGVMRSWLVSGISPSLRSILHEKTGSFLEETWQEPSSEILTEIAHHYCNSRNRTRALTFSARAAKRTYIEGKHSDSIHWYREYLSRISEGEDPVEFFRAQINIGNLFSITGQPEEAEEHMYKALELAADTVDRCAVFFRLGDNFRRRSMYSEAMEQYEKAITIGRSTRNKSRALVDNMVGALLESSFISRQQGRLDDAASSLEEARKCLDGSEDGFEPAMEGMYYARLADVEAERGEPERALETYRKGLDICISENDPTGQALILNNMHGLFELSGDYNSMLDTLKQVVKLNMQLDDQLGLAIAYYNLAEAYMTLNMLDLARRYFQLYIELNSRIENKLGMGYGQLGLGKLLMLEKKNAQAGEYLHNAAEIFQELDCRELMLDAQAERAMSHINRSEFQEANTILDSLDLAECSTELANRMNHLRGYLMVKTGDSQDRGIFMVESSIRNAENITPGEIVLMYGNLYDAYLAAGHQEQALHALSNGVEVLEETIRSVKTDSLRNGILARMDVTGYLDLCRETGVACSL